jgi:hypothetical protein
MQEALALAALLSSLAVFVAVLTARLVGRRGIVPHVVLLSALAALSICVRAALLGY